MDVVKIARWYLERLQPLNIGWWYYIFVLEDWKEEIVDKETQELGGGGLEGREKNCV